MKKKNIYSGRVIFDHRPKTAGTAVKVWLEEMLGTASVAHVVHGAHRDLISMYGGNYPIICSHVKFTRNGETLDPRYQYVTCLRDPVDRALSWLYFALNTIPYDFEGPLGRGHNIKAMVKSVIDSEGDEFPDKLQKTLGNIYTRHFSKIETENGNGNDQVDRAYETLRRYDVVGIYEDMPGFLGEFAGMLGMPAPKKIRRENVTIARPQKKKVSTKLRRKLEDLNEKDIELFERVCRLKKEEAKKRPKNSGKTCVYTRYDRPNLRGMGPDIAISPAEIRPGKNVAPGEKVGVDVCFVLDRDVDNFDIELRIYDAYERVVCLERSNANKKPVMQKSGAYRVRFDFSQHLPVGEYKFGVRFYGESEDGNGVILLGRDDRIQSLSVFPKNARVGTGYAGLNAEITIEELEMASTRVSDGKGNIVFSGPLPVFAPQSEKKLAIEIVNGSSQDWRGDAFCPVNLSYHLLDSRGETVVFDGLRTPLPGEVVPAGGRMEAEIKVCTPVPPGTYRLAPSLVQENVCWFEEIGFSIEPVEIKVA